MPIDPFKFFIHWAFKLSDCVVKCQTVNTHEDACCVSLTNPLLCVYLQLFRRVAAALPGMESMQETSKEGSILSTLSSCGVKNLFFSLILM